MLMGKLMGMLMGMPMGMPMPDASGSSGWGAGGRVGCLPTGWLAGLLAVWLWRCKMAGHAGTEPRSQKNSNKFRCHSAASTSYRFFVDW